MDDGGERVSTALTGCACALALAAALLLTAAGGDPAGAATSCDLPAPTATSQEFTQTGKTHHFQVPPGVDTVRLTAWGGHGGKGDHTADGGNGAVTSGSLHVTPGQCLDVYVGAYGGGHGGSGYAHGGDHGTDPGTGLGNSAAGGGGSSAVTLANGDLVVGAGGGGGGGGDGGQDHWGGQGGDANDGIGGDKGQGGGDGGCGACRSVRGGGDGGDLGSGGQSGAGGGGGGGTSYGGGGGDGGGSEFTDNGGGGGGGGGDSGTGAGAFDTNQDTSDRPCPYRSTPSTCNGAVRISWTPEAPIIKVLGGDGQHTQPRTLFPRPLTVKLQDKHGNPIPGLPVTFTLPAGDEAGGWLGPALEEKVTSQTVTANKHGVAVSGLVEANTVAGSWAARVEAPDGAEPVRLDLTNDPLPSKTVVSSRANPTLSGEKASFTADVSIPAPFVPAGTVHFYADGQPFGAPAAVTAQGTATSSALPLDAGEHQIRAEFEGDRHQFDPSSATLAQQVDKAPTATTLTSSPNPSQAGAGVVFRAEVKAGAAELAGVPTGAVEFEVDGVPVATVPLDAQGVAATAPIPIAALGPHAVTADYAGDSDFEASAGASTQDVGADATHVDIATGTNPSAYGAPLTVEATVKGAGAEPPPGQVTFRVDGDEYCSTALSPGTGPESSAECGLTGPLAPGDHVIEVSYPGATGFDPSTGSRTQTVTGARTVTTLGPLPGDAVFGSPVALRARVDVQQPGFGDPDGEVRFSVDGAYVGEPVPVSGGAAAGPTISSLPAGPHVFRADYSGDTRFTSSDASVAERIARAPTTTTVSPSANPLIAGNPLTVSAAVATPAPGAGPATGDVQLALDGEDLGTAIPLPPGGSVSAPAGTPALGGYGLAAYYSGDANHSPSSASAGVSVTPPSPPAKKKRCKAKKPKGKRGKRNACKPKKKGKKRKGKRRKGSRR